MPDNQSVSTEMVAALKQSSTETKQLEAVFERLLQVLTQNGFQIQVDIVGMLQTLANRLDSTEKQAEGISHQLEQLEELLRTFSLITSSLELDRVLEDVMDTVIRLTGAERAYLMLSNKDTAELELSVARNWDQENIADTDAVFSSSIVNQALKENQAILTTNAQADDRFQNVKSVVNNQLRSILCIPLMLQGRVIGALYADNRITQDVFRREQIPLLTAFGTQAAIAIENARRFGAVKKDLDNALTELKSLQIELDRGHVEKQVNQITEFGLFPAAFFGGAQHAPAFRRQAGRVIDRAQYREEDRITQPAVIVADRRVGAYRHRRDYRRRADDSAERSADRSGGLGGRAEADRCDARYARRNADQQRDYRQRAAGTQPTFLW